MKREGLSVVIPHFGDPEPTGRLIEQLKNQATERPMQLIVVDDASPVPLEDIGGVEVVKRERNGGFAAAVNTGLDRVYFPHLVVLNSDVSVTPDFVEQLMTSAAAIWPAVVAPRVREAFGERCMGHGWPTARAVALEQLLPLARFHGQRWYEHQTNNLLETIGITAPRQVDWVTGICLLMPTDDVRAVGGLDERYFMNCEEVDLQKRLADDRGIHAYVVPEPVLTHVGGASSPTEKQAGWVLDARLRYYEKWRGGSGLKNALTAAAWINFAWNSAKRLGGRPTQPRTHFRGEMSRLNHAWRTRR